MNRKHFTPTMHGDWIVDSAGRLVDQSKLAPAAAGVESAPIESPEQVPTVEDSTNESTAADAATETAGFFSGNRNRSFRNKR
jgi:hypothetical protein